MEYKRLTKIAENGKPYFDGCLCCDLESDCGLCPYWESGLDRLAELEDKIEQGTLIELPCKVGDTVYWISSNNRYIIEAVVEKISFTMYDMVILLVEEKGVGEYSIPLVWDIFLTREEAEKRLKELQNG